MNIPRSIALLLALLVGSHTSSVFSAPGETNERGNYPQLVTLFLEFDEWRNPAIGSYADYRIDEIEKRKAQLADFHSRLAGLDVRSWSIPEQVDYLAVRSRLDQEDFVLSRFRPWSRDPGFYVDRMLRVTFTALIRE